MTQDLAKLATSQYIAINPSEGGLSLQDLIEANGGGNGGFGLSDITKVSVPGAGGMTWAIPHPLGEVSARELTGVILFARDPRSYYKYKPTDVVPDDDIVEGANLPDCASDDGITGQATSVGVKRGMPAEVIECATCPLAQWGTAIGGTGKGKACAERRELFMMLPDRLLPIIVTAPTTSLQAMRAYMNGLMQFATPIYAVETTLTLKREERGGMKWSTIIPAMSGKLSGEDALKMRDLANQFKSVLARQPRVELAVTAA